MTETASSRSPVLEASHLNCVNKRCRSGCAAALDPASTHAPEFLGASGSQWSGTASFVCTGPVSASRQTMLAQWNHCPACKRSTLKSRGKHQPAGGAAWTSGTCAFGRRQTTRSASVASRHPPEGSGGDSAQRQSKSLPACMRNENTTHALRARVAGGGMEDPRGHWSPAMLP